MPRAKPGSSSQIDPTPSGSAAAGRGDWREVAAAAESGARPGPHGVQGHPVHRGVQVLVKLVADICRRLDGLPLAIELAAARIRTLPIQELARRLDDRFRLLTSGARTAVRRRQTLRAAIDWSYELLTEPERLLLARLSVFAGTWSLEAAEAVCGDQRVPADQMLELVSRLADRSLLQPQRGSAARFRLLETIRAYATERLEDHGEAQQLRRRHADDFLGLAEAPARIRKAPRRCTRWRPPATTSEPPSPGPSPAEPTTSCCSSPGRSAGTGPPGTTRKASKLCRRSWTRSTGRLRSVRSGLLASAYVESICNLALLFGRAGAPR
jgi:hypothetical protein